MAAIVCRLVLEVELLGEDGAKVDHDPRIGETTRTQLFPVGHVPHIVLGHNNRGQVAYRADEEGALVHVDLDHVQHQALPLLVVRLDLGLVVQHLQAGDRPKVLYHAP